VSEHWLHNVKAPRHVPNANLIKANEVTMKQVEAQKQQMKGNLTIEATLFAYPSCGGAAKKVRL